jgi:hypothetical protein
MAVVRQVRSAIVAGLVFKKIVSEKAPNVPGALGLYMARTELPVLAPAALGAGPSVGEQTFTIAELADLDPRDHVVVTYMGAQTANVAILDARCSAAGVLAIKFFATTGTPTPAAASAAVPYLVVVTRMG